MRVLNKILFAISLLLSGIASIYVYNNPAVEKFEISKTQLQMTINSSVNLTYNIQPDSAKIKKYEIDWVSSNKSVAVVKDGKIEAVGVGKAVVTVTYKDFKQKCEIEVLPINVNSVSINSEYTIIHPGETMQMSVSYFPADATYKDVVWESSNSSVATISRSGIVTGVGEGQTTITVTAHNGVKNTKVIKVKKVVDVQSIELSIDALNKDALTVRTYKLKYNPVPANADVGEITWSSSNSEIISVDESGYAMVKKDGSVNITARTQNGKIANISLNVPRVEADMVTIKSSISSNMFKMIELRVGQTTQLIANVFCYGNAVPTTRDVVWVSEYENWLTVDQNGLVTAVAAPSSPLVIPITVNVVGVSNVKATIMIVIVD